MSERIYAWLLNLYPGRFRQAYGTEAMQLFRDRLGEERTFYARLRLWFDLLADLAVSVPRLYWLEPASTPQPHPGGMPTFQLLAKESLPRSAVLLGSLLSIAVFAVCPILMNQVTIAHSAPQETAVRKRDLDAPERRRVLDGVIANLKRHYVDPDVGRKIADSLRSQQQRGVYDAVPMGSPLAALLTKHMREISPDKRLIVIYSQTPLPPQPSRSAMAGQNCTVEKVEVLPHNVGYLKMNSFPDLAVCRSAAVGAMRQVNTARAVIFDLRDNWGGYPDMVAFIAAYLFDHPEYLYNPRENTTRRSWTRSPVAGSRLADKPVYILTSARTRSGAEQFSYDLKMLKRATLVGETTAGSAHAGIFYRIDDHFGMGIPETSPINPFSDSDWEETGVEPDVKVPAAAALQKALTLVK